MKKTISVLMLILLLSSCKKSFNSQDTKSATQNPAESSNNLTSRESLDTVPVLLVETSPGVYETPQNYKGAHLIFTDLQVYGGRPYAKLASARSFGTNPGTNLYNIVIEGLNEQGSLQRSFLFQTYGCVSVTKGQKTLWPDTSYNALAPFPNAKVFSYLNSTPLSGSWFDMSQVSMWDLYESSELTPWLKYKISVTTGTFTNCSSVNLVTGKIIARKKTFVQPFEYEYYVAPLSNYNEDSIIPPPVSID